MWATEAEAADEAYGRQAAEVDQFSKKAITNAVHVYAAGKFIFDVEAGVPAPSCRHSVPR